MDLNSSMKNIMGVLVVMIVIVSIAIPLIAQSNMSTETSNTADSGTGRYSEYSGTLTVSIDADGVIQLNGEQSTFLPGSIAFGEEFAIRSSGNSIDIMVRTTTYSISTSNPGTITISESGTQYRVEIATGTTTSTYISAGRMFIQDESGPLIDIYSATSEIITVLEGTEMIIMPYQYGRNGSGFGTIVGSEMTICGMYRISTTTAASGEVTKIGFWHAPEIVSNGTTTSYIGPFTFEMGRASATNGDIGMHVLVPESQIYVSESQQTINSMMNIIPIIMIVGLVVAAVAALIKLKSGQA